MLDDSEVVANQRQGHIDELLTDNVIARLYTQTSQHIDRQTDTHTHRQTNRHTDRQTEWTGAR